MKYIDTDKLKQDMSDAISQAVEKTTGFKGDAHDQIRHAKEKINESKERSRRYVRENPENALMIAGAAGLITGMIITMMAIKRRG